MTRFIARLAGWLKYRLALLMARSDSRSRLDRIAPQRVLVLCYGNIYRSPYVEYYLRNLLGDSTAVEIRSAGFHHRSGRESPAEHIERCKQQYNVDLGQHRSQQVDRQLLEWADIVVIMDGNNFNSVRLLDSHALNKVIWLGALNPQTPIEIADPYGRQNNEQDAIVGQLSRATETLARQLIRS